MKALQGNEIIRVVGCQGSIQFMTAVNTLVLRSATSGASQNNQVYKHYLLVYDLFAPVGQDQSFFSFIKRMAEQKVIPFDRILYLTPDSIKGLQDIFAHSGINGIREEILRITGVPRVDELYLGTNWQPVNKLLMNCFEDSVKICYGDSIGLHIPEGYFAEQNWRVKISRSRWLQPVVRIAKNVKIAFRFSKPRTLFGALKEINFEKGYYVTTALTAQLPPWAFDPVEPAHLKKTFSRYAQLFPFEELEKSFSLTGRITVITTTNFSEAGRMTLESELSAYLEFIGRNLAGHELLIIKPHPRDSAVKLKRLEKMLTDHSYTVKLLADLDYYFIPFELALLRIEMAAPEQLHRIKHLTFSSACLSIKLLFNQDPVIGLGEDLVQKYFEPSHKAPRIKHEKDLKRILSGNLSFG